MAHVREFLDFAAGVFGVPVGGLSLETTYGSIPEWDSMAQLRLVMEIAARYGVEIPFAEVTVVQSLWEFFRRINGLSPKKVVAVDLDNTLWDGVVGEDGLDGIRPNGDLLRTLKALKSRGVLLVVLSKNNEEDGLAGLEKLGRTGELTKDDFVAWRIDWNEKPGNLRAIAEELNLGTDAFVFVDDNPAERLKMKTLLPDVAVASFPPDLSVYFPEVEITDEDRRKTEEYRAEAQRKRRLANVEGPDVWQALGCWMDVHEMTEGECVRVAQLSQKANQFNVCTNRRSETDVRRLAREELVVTCRVGDRFGDQGLVAFAVVCRGTDGEARIADWVMSCRVTGRGVEERFEAETERILKTLEIRELTAVWKKSGKNAPVRDLFDRLGFGPVEVTADERRYRKRI